MDSSTTCCMWHASSASRHELLLTDYVHLPTYTSVCGLYPRPLRVLLLLRCTATRHMFARRGLAERIPSSHCPRTLHHDDRVPGHDHDMCAAYCLLYYLLMIWICAPSNMLLLCVRIHTHTHTPYPPSPVPPPSPSPRTHTPTHTPEPPALPLRRLLCYRRDGDAQ